MSESFNPYVEWLGFTSGRQPADYYELLGIDRFQSDPAAISHAADVLTSRIRRVRPGGNLAAWQDLLDQLRLAKTCLLDPASKAAYDASLGGPPQPPPAEPAYSPPPTAQPPGGPVMALPPTSVWGAPQPSPPAAPQVGPVPGPYASPSLPGGTPSSPSSGGREVGPTYPPPSAPVQEWNPAGSQPQAAFQGWNPFAPRPDLQPPSTPGPYPAQQPYSQPTSTPGSYPAQQPYSQPTPTPAPYPAQQPYSQQPPSPGPYPAQQQYPQPTPTPGSYPAQQPYSQPTSAPAPYPAQQPYLQQPSTPGPYPAQQPYPQQPYSQPTPTPAPYPAQQPYPGPNAWANPPGAAGYLPAGASPLPGQPQGYPGTGAAGAAPSWAPANQGGPAQGWGYPAMAPVPRIVDLPVAQISAAPTPIGAAPADTAPTGAPWAAEPAVGPPPTATTVPDEYAPTAPPAEAPAPAEAAFIDDSLMDGILPSTKLSRGPVRQKSPIVRTLVNLLVLVAIAVAGVLGYKYYQQTHKGSHTTSDLLASATSEVKPPPPPPGTSKAAPPRVDSKKPAPAPGGVKPPPKKPDAKPSPPTPPKPPDKPKPDPGKKPGAADPAKQKAFKLALTAARIALSQRDAAGLKRYLTVASQNAQGPDDQAVIERLTLMGDYLEKYWEGIGRTMSQLAVAEEILIGKSHLAVVETDASSITVHDEGKNKTFTVAQLPPVLMRFMAEQWLRKDPDAKVYYGVYLAISPKGDRDRARALLEEAAKHDSNIEKLLPELDEAPVPAGGDTAAKSAPPEKAKLGQILQTIRDKYKTDYDQASTPRGKGALAKILLDNGRAVFDDMDQRFGMLAAAQQEAIAAGDAALACEAVGEMGKLHTIDVFEKKVTTLEGLGEATRSLAGQRQIAETSLAMAGTAMDANRLEEASRLAKLAMSAALKAKNVPTIKQARGLYLQIQTLRKQKSAGKGS